MRVETFRVELSGFRVRELPSKRCQCFVVGNFDNFKQFKTSSEDNELYGAKWEKFEMLFYYETKFVDKLDKKSFEMDIFQKKIFRNHKLGRVVVDLYTLATGPEHHDIMILSDNNVSVGRLEFDCKFEHFPMSLKDLTLCLPPDFEYNKHSQIYLQLSFYPDSKTDVIYKTDISRASNKYFHWQLLSILRANYSTKKLLSTKMLIEVKEKRKSKNKTIGVCWIKFKRIFNPKDPETPIPINLKLSKYIHRYHPQHESSHNASNTIGMLKGYFLFEHPPKYGQMLDGVHTENGVFRGTPQLGTLPTPVFLRNPDSPDGRYSSIGCYYETRFSQKQNSDSNSNSNSNNKNEFGDEHRESLGVGISFEDIEREKFEFECEISKLDISQNSNVNNEVDEEGDKENSHYASNLIEKDSKVKTKGKPKEGERAREKRDQEREKEKGRKYR